MPTALSTKMREKRARILSVVGLATSLVLAFSLIAPSVSAQAAAYPSWQDLQAAKSNTAAAAAQVESIKALLVGLQAEKARTEAEALARSIEFQTAQDKFDAAARRATDLQEQADSSKTTADTATRQAGQLAAQLYRSGGTDLSVNLLLDGTGAGEGATELLSKLGSMSKLVQRSSEVYEQAQSATNIARSLGDQATVARAEREKLRVAAETAMDAAQAASDAAGVALAESEAKSIELDQQLKFMQDAQATTANAYEAGVAERARLAAEAAAAAAAAAGGAGGGGGGSGSAGPGLGGGYISSQGWAVPASGRITDVFGQRPIICGGGSCSNPYHSGTDIGTGCYSPIYAANGGEVTYSGRNGTYGNYIQIDHGGGVSTGYAHIRDGGLFVSKGQRVDVGQNIASSGTTGASDGCHLHFEVRINGQRVDAQPFMASMGAPLG
ncbi:peptidoglycan DD-metalloendopeptidase family protein [Leifsonia sp. YAF41]|uniref:peptidoglycan DD-metalloendopeptidase family protein n=1 Tax=Leifsonia sp. YAF41 TaxID=3233086 RepID=UPI003F9DCF12